MNACCYILFSPSINKYYIGCTSKPPEDRLREHNTAFFGSTCFTAKTSDWVLFFIIPCNSIEQALKIEKHIKKMHSSSYLSSLKEHPELITKLLNIYSS